MRNIYFDNAATTKVDGSVFSSMKPYFLAEYGNASEYHLLGRGAKKAVEKSRLQVASFLGAKNNEVIFTGSATESINLAIKGLVEKQKQETRQIPEIIVSAIEHKAVLETCRHLEILRWAKVKYLPVDKYGLINISVLEGMITEKTLLVSIMYVNNEVGTIQPLSKVGIILKNINKKRDQKVFFHTDATQAMLYQNCNVDFLGADLLSFSGHKIRAPKGVGVLYMRKGTPFVRQVDGGGQEMGARSGTENVPYIIGLGRAIELVKNKDRTNVRLIKLRDKIIKSMLLIPGVRLTGHPNYRSPHIASFLVRGVEGESVVLRLSEKGVYISSGSACTSSDLSPSHVLTAMGYSPEESHGSIRISLGDDNTSADVKFFLSVIKKVIEDLRKMSPLS